MPIISAIGRLRKEDHKFKASMGCIGRWNGRNSVIILLISR
jgi:hypothetical protein